MISIPGYHIKEQLYEGESSLILRGVSDSDQKPVILKLLKKEYPSPEDLAKFRREYDILKKISSTGVVRAHSLENYKNTILIILEDLGGQSLSYFYQGKTVDISAFLRVGIQLASILETIHHQRVIHKDINPANILYFPQTGDVKLIDFGISTELSFEIQAILHPNVLEGTLAYISPEQTGRMNCAIDYRTDLYSLGITFYEILTGQLPFEADDAIGWVHCHIAKSPEPPHQKNAHIPKVLSNIILKLMAKSPEDRYRSAQGLKADFQRCLDQLIKDGNLTEFPLAQKDLLEKFQLPQKLYGREREVHQMLQSFDRMLERGTQMMMVSGYPGTGKTTLIAEIHKKLVEKQGFFISGKFDQFKRNEPYSALSQAFRDLTKQLLSETDEKLLYWKTQIMKALGNNGQVLIDLIPELTIIIGEQPPVPEIGAIETQNRFQRVFHQFISVFALQEHPLVIFLDDLQWADSSTLNLLKVLMTTLSGNYLFFVGAYRNNEVDPAHPFSMTLEDIQKAGTAIKFLMLNPLHPEDLNHFIADTFHTPLHQAESLAKVVYGKTGGNPFFVGEFVKFLYKKKLAWFDHETMIWEWDLPRIDAEQTTDNVVDLMIDKISKLPEATQHALKMASCIGPTFDLKTLAVICKCSLRQVAVDLWPAVQEELLMPLSDQHKLLLSMEEHEVEESATNTLKTLVKFLHDRIQQAAHELIDGPLQKSIHLQIGNLLLEHISPSQLEEDLFYIVSQLNIGKKLIKKEAEKIRLAALNLKACRKAKLSTAYGPALGHAKLGLGLLAKASWNTNYELTLSLYTEATDNAYLCTEFDLMENYASAVFSNAHSILDKVMAYETKIHAHIVQDKPLDAVKTALIALKQLGVRLPNNPSLLHVALEVIKTKLTLASRPIAVIEKLPLMSDPEKLAASRILASTIPAAYIAMVNMAHLLILRSLVLSVKFGNNPYSYTTYTSFGAILAGGLGDANGGYEFAQLALRLLDKNKAYGFKAKVLLLLGMFIQHWKKPARLSIPLVTEACQCGLEVGDFEYASFAAHNYCALSFLTGKNLKEVLSGIERYNLVIEQVRNQTALNYNHMYQQAILNLTSEVQNPCQLIGEAYDETAMLPHHLATKDNAATLSVYLLKAMLAYLLGDYESAIKNTDLNRENGETQKGMMHIPIYFFYDALIHLAVIEQQPENKKKGLQRASKNLKRLKKWSMDAPENQLHRCLLIEAELARFQNDDLQAMNLYQKAIKEALKNQYTHEAAIANELAAKFYLLRGEDSIARLFLRDAVYLYSQWGAVNKVLQLEKQYPAMLSSVYDSNVSPSVNAKKTATIATIHTTQAGIGSLDMMTVIKASQAISGEIVLEHLLEKMLAIIIESAGAQKGLLIEEKEGNLVVTATKLIDREHSADQQTEDQQTTPTKELPITQSFPSTLLHFAARTRENIVLDDARENAQFAGDPYFSEQTPKSILCMPILHKGKLLNLLYLENHLTPGAFTESRLEIIKILSAQAAISIENAKLYSNLGKSVRMEAELKTAAAVQHALLPLSTPSISNMDIACYYQSASETGGDWYGFMTQLDKSLYVMIGDVTGHGSPAALVTAAASTACGLLEELSEGTPPPLPKVLHHLNRAVFKTGRSEYLMTFFIAAIHLETGLITFSNAGHNFPLCLDSQGKINKLLNRNPRLGETELVAFTEGQQQLFKGDLLFFFTDGLVENISPQGEEWGDKRLRNFLRTNRNSTSQTIVKGLVDEMNLFNEGLPLGDDVTMVVLQINGDFNHTP
ncbi:AAA family ATPase [Deltaproteobacteria bacterium TL4]